MCRKGRKTYTQTSFVSLEHYAYCAFTGMVIAMVSMHKLATIQFRSSEFNLMQQPHITNKCTEFGIMLRLNCSASSSWFMFIGMKTAIKLDHVAIKCIKINSFSNCRSHFISLVAFFPLCSALAQTVYFAVLV